jgi:hypothetical protein
LLYFSFRGIQFHEIFEILKKADFKLVLIPVIFVFVSLSIATVRWSKIAGGNVGFLDTFVAFIIGLFVNNVLPARIGEVARGYVLSKKTGLSFGYAFSTVLVDRFFDLIGLLILTFMFLPEHSLPTIVSKGISTVLVLLILCIAIMIIMSRKKFAHIFSEKLLKTDKPLFTKFAHKIIEIQKNLKRINSPFNIIYLIALSFFVWLSMSLSLYFVMLTLGISIKFSYIPFVCALLNMGLTIPSSPGYIGVYQFLLVYLLSIFDVPKHEGFIVSILYHASWYVPYNIIGFILLLREHLKIRDLKELKGED